MTDQTNEVQTKILSKEFIWGFALQMVIVCGGGLMAFTTLRADVENHQDQDHIPAERVRAIEENVKALVRQTDKIASKQEQAERVLAKLEAYLEVEERERIREERARSQ